MSINRKVRIVSPGMGAGTTVTDLETGAELRYVRRIEISPIVPDQANTARIDVIVPDLDIVAEAEIEGLLLADLAKQKQTAGANGERGDGDDERQGGGSPPPPPTPAGRET